LPSEPAPSAREPEVTGPKLTKASRLFVDPGTGLGPQQMLAELLALYKDLTSQLLPNNVDCAECYKATVTADFLTGPDGAP